MNLTSSAVKLSGLGHLHAASTTMVIFARGFALVYNRRYFDLYQFLGTFIHSIR